MAALALIAVVVGKSEARPAAPRVCRLPVISATATTVWVHILLIGCLLGVAGATAPSPPPWWEFCGDATCNSAVADTEAPSS